MNAERSLALSFRIWALAFLVWFSGLGGTELYKLPLIFWGLWAAWAVWRRQGDSWASVLGRWVVEAARTHGGRTIAWVSLAVFALWLAVFCAQYWALELNTWDVALHSNILGNLSRGAYYSSYLNIHPLGDHFTPLMAPLALPYLVFPSPLWLMGFKAAAFALTGWLFYLTGRDAPGLGSWGPVVGVLLGLGWLLFYGPAVRALAYEFQASALAPPLVVGAFWALQCRRWAWFGLCLLLMLGAKEHLGAVWIGFGAFLVAGPPGRRRLGGLLILGGVLAIGGIMFGLMPWFRDGLPAWSGPERIAPLTDLDLKAQYLLRLLLPLGFLPLLHPRALLLAAPLIGINLLSGWPAMYSTNFHYDDLSSTLLLLGLIPTFAALRQRGGRRAPGRRRLALGLVGLLLFAQAWPRPPLRYLYRSWPSPETTALVGQVARFRAAHPQGRLAVADRLGGLFARKDIEVIETRPGENCVQTYRHPRTQGLPEPRFVVFAPRLPDPQIADPDACLQDFENSPQFQRLDHWPGLAVFVNLHSQPGLAPSGP